MSQKIPRLYPKLTIYGIAGSYAEEYAKEAERIKHITSEDEYIYRPIPFVAVQRDPVSYATSYPITVDGQVVNFDAYALRDENGYDTNYIKLRDLAYILNGKNCQFQVSWDGAITITTGTAYTPNGSEMATPFAGDQLYADSAATTKINGRAADLAAIELKDSGGGGYTYYKLRDLGQALGFYVGWSAETGIIIDTTRPYEG